MRWVLLALLAGGCATQEKAPPAYTKYLFVDALNSGPAARGDTQRRMDGAACRLVWRASGGAHGAFVDCMVAKGWRLTGVQQTDSPFDE